jgi:cell division initiation protein
MKLTPLDVQQKSFRRARLSGVDEREVRAFLELCASEMEELTRRLHKQDEELRQREAQIAEYRSREQLLQKTLTTAQKLAEEMKAQARKETEIVLSDAELQAEKIIANAQNKRLQLIGEIDELKRARAGFLQQLGGMLDSHKALLDTMRTETPPETPKAQAPASDNVSFLAPPTKRAETKK